MAGRPTFKSPACGAAAHPPPRQHFAGDQLRRRDHEDPGDALRGRQLGDRANIDEVAISVLAHLIETVADSISHLAEAYRDMEALSEMDAQLLRYVTRPIRREI